MIIKRKYSGLVFISPLPGLDLKSSISPGNPDNWFWREGEVKPGFKLLRFYGSIDSGLSLFIPGQEIKPGSRFYIYRPLSLSGQYLLEPDISQLPWVLEEKEYWYTQPCRLEFLGIIEIVDSKKGNTIHYGKHAKSLTLLKYTWKIWGEQKKWEIKRQEEKLYTELAPRTCKPEKGVIYKVNGSWRIVSFKKNPPRLWKQHYETKENAERALAAYHANK